MTTAVSGQPRGHVTNPVVVLPISGVTSLSARDGSGDLNSIDVFPLYENVSRAFVDYVIKQDWTSFTVLYDSDDGR